MFPSIPFNSRRWLFPRWLATALVAAAAPVDAAEQGEFKLSSLNWIKGPAKADMKGIASIDVPKDYMFVDGGGARKLMEAMGNFTSGSEVGLLAPTGMVWFAIFRFSDDGYVKDDDKDKLDADKILRSIRDGTEAANKERKRRGWATMKVVGWQQPPAYNETTHNLEWAVIGESENERVINYNTRILGRRGVMEVKLVVGSEELESYLPAYKQLVDTFDYKAGERYSEYKPGDKLAQYGLTALVAGGAVAVAAKTGLLASIVLLFKKAWKLVIVGLIAVGAFIKRLIFGRSDRQTVE
jgi:uncharacterized membrane-anchored protein